MELQTALKIAHMSSRMGLSIKLYPGYTGKSMFGKMTTAITVENDDDLIAVCSAITGDMKTTKETLTFNKEIRLLRVDTIKKGLIYY